MAVAAEFDAFDHKIQIDGNSYQIQDIQEESAHHTCNDKLCQHTKTQYDLWYRDVTRFNARCAAAAEKEIMQLEHELNNIRLTLVFGYESD